ncbi:MAG: protein phosphatase 2C domain-containing protein [bacterium]|nr:MAG: protein phosphatase 2C domain-containing protein [bacterium]
MPENTKRRLVLEYGSKSDQGMVRSDNQDFFGKFPAGNDDLSYPKGQLFLIADGMGGHERGREASETAVRIIGEVYYSSKQEGIAESLREAMEAANGEIFQRANKGDGIVKMGTTCTALVISEHQAFIAHIGDSRIYRLNSEGIAQLTEDHTQVAEMYRKGILSEEEAQHHPSQSVLVRALGVKQDIEIDLISNILLRADDHFILCTDGLGKVPLEDIRQTVLSNPPQKACDILVEHANRLGGHDNITIQVIEMGQKIQNTAIEPPKIRKKSSGNWSRRFIVSMIIIILLAILYVYRDLLFKGISGIFSMDKNGTELPSEPSLKSEKPGDPENSPDKIQLEEAIHLVELGNLDEALKIYLEVLTKDPMNLASINGIDQIVAAYNERARKYQDNKDYHRAMIYYQKALELHPKDQELRDAIVQCESLLKKPANQSDSSITPLKAKETKIDQSQAGSGLETIQPLHKIDTYDPANKKDWEFLNLTADDYKFNENGITFYETNMAKMVIFKEKLEDLDIEVTVKLSDGFNEGRIGIILGYQKRINETEKSFFQFSKISSKEFVLEKKQQSQNQQLLSIPYHSDNSESSLNFKLKVKCLGPWLMVYHNNKMLKAWLNDELIRGQVGLYAGPRIQVGFSHIQIGPAVIQNNEMVDESQLQENEE